MQSSLDTLVDQTFSTLRLMREHMRQSRPNGSLSHLQLVTLHYIATTPGATMRNMAQYFNITPPSITSLVSGLVKLKYLARIPDKQDRRIMRLKLTPQGEKVFGQELSRMRERLKKMLLRLNEQERRILITILQKLSQ